ncbi:B3/B4 domain-containing protein [Bradyrhizobium japonicum]|uniref:B3/B4 domain-containing protein n=1 Tax=Bradyrhizobium japonicum TaxID=375 RepID=UPI001BA58516|nr:phenylalanine--tRNA ligase beta subunit-related protein [Bradyrhizobium japonicum]MBR0764486.1 hypothetical protein [Bradyrhizobium japonicum]
MTIEISPELRSLAPRLALGVITARVVVRQNDSRLWSEIERRAENLKATLSIEQLSVVDGIRALRQAYRSMGKDPARFRGSQEALIRRILKSQPLYQINTVVDINNLVSLTSLHSVGSYNLANLHGTITFRIGRAGEKYKGIGKSIIDTESLPVFSDEIGAFGSPTSDSERALISLDTRDMMMVVIAFAGSSSLDQDLAFASSLLCEYAAPEAGSLSCSIVE